MPKSPSLTDVTGTFADITVNNNSREIENAFKNTLSRDGSTPNQMGADLDLNNNDLLNSKVVFAQDVVIEELGSLGSILDQLAGGPEWASKEAPIANRSIASNTLIPNNIQTIVVRHNGKLLQYVRDPQGTALTTFGGDTWSPDASLPVWVEHWGAVGYDTPAEAIVDSTIAIQAGVLWQRGDLLLDGWYKVSSGIKHRDGPRGARLHSVRGRRHGGLAVKTDFDLNAQGVIYSPPGQTAGFSIGDLGFDFDQEAAKTSGLRGSLIQYPPAIDLGISTEAILGNIQISKGWQGIVTDQNAGALRIGSLDIGCFNVGLKLDNLLGMVHVDSIRAWPFGSAGTPLVNIFYDGQSDAIILNRVDGWSCDKLLAFRQRVTLNTNTGTAAIPSVWGSMQMDGDGANLVVNSGNHNIGNWYSTRTGNAVEPALKMVGGRASISNGRFMGSSPTEVEVQGGSLEINGGCLGKNGIARLGAKVLGGHLSLKNMEFYWGGSGSRSDPMVKQESAGRLFVEGCFSPNTTDVSDLIQLSNARNHLVDMRALAPHKLSVPDTSVGQYFTSSFAITPSFSFETPGDLSVSYLNREFRWYLDGRVLKWELRLVFTPTFTSSQGFNLISAPGLPPLSTPSEHSLASLGGVSHQGNRSDFFLRAESGSGVLRLLESGGDNSRNLSPSNFISGQQVTVLGNGSFWL